jgi:hypothetical protein
VYLHLLQFAGVQPVMQGLLSKLEQVNATVIALTASMEAAHGNLVAANDNMVSGLVTPQLRLVYMRWRLWERHTLRCACCNVGADQIGGDRKA